MDRKHINAAALLLWARQWRHSIGDLLLCGGIVGSLVGCSGDTVNGPPPPSPAQAYWALTLNQHAVNMALTAPYDTVQLRAVPFNALGDTLHGLGAVTYSAVDSSVVVSTTGLVTAKMATDSTSVIASLTYHGVTLADTINIQITDTVPTYPVATFSLQPAFGDSTIRALGYYNFACHESSGFCWDVNITDTHHDTLCARIPFSACALLVDYRSSNPSVATIGRQTGGVRSFTPGRVTFYATTVAYGKPLQDSVHFTISNTLVTYVDIVPLTTVSSLTPILLFEPTTTHVNIGGTVVWSNTLQLPIDVVFEDPTHVASACTPLLGTPHPCDDPNYPAFYYPATGSGDIAAFQVIPNSTNHNDFSPNDLNAHRSRQFPVAGVYPYHSARYPTSTGVIIVNDSL